MLKRAKPHDELLKNKLENNRAKALTGFQHSLRENVRAYKWYAKMCNYQNLIIKVNFTKLLIFRKSRISYLTLLKDGLDVLEDF